MGLRTWPGRQPPPAGRARGRAIPRNRERGVSRRRGHRRTDPSGLGRSSAGRTRYSVHKHLSMVEGVQNADAVFFLGYHARTGDSDGVANETILGREIVEIRLN